MKVNFHKENFAFRLALKEADINSEMAYLDNTVEKQVREIDTYGFWVSAS